MDLLSHSSEGGELFDSGLDGAALLPAAGEYLLRCQSAIARVIDAAEAALGEALGSPALTHARIAALVDEPFAARHGGELARLGIFDPTAVSTRLPLINLLQERHVLAVLFRGSSDEVAALAERRPEEFLRLLDRRLEETGTALRTALPALHWVGIAPAIGPFAAHPLWESLAARNA